MWKLTIERKHTKFICDSELNCTEEMELEFDCISDAMQYINATRAFGKGEFKYILDYVKKEGEAKC